MRVLQGETFVRDMVLFSVKAAPARAIMERTGYLFSTDGFEGRWDGEHQNRVHAIESILINLCVKWPPICLTKNQMLYLTGGWETWVA